MIRLHADAPAASVPRRDGQYSTLPILLTLVGTLACGGENSIAPPTDLKPPAIHYLVAVGALDYTTPDAPAATTVKGMESNIQSMSVELGTTPPNYAYSRVIPTLPTLSTSVGSTVPSAVNLTGLSTSTLSASQTKAGGGAAPPPIAFYLPNGCKKAYIDCQGDCLLTRMEFNQADFWDNIFNPFHTWLNHLSGGPQDRMRDSYYTIAEKVRQYRAQDCSHYI
jgi:hypothetical protein